MIGIFDSGLGGLNVLKKLKSLEPDQSFIYLGDLARMPYGEKSLVTIKNYSFFNTRFLIEKGAKIIVIACNTASASAYYFLKDKFNVPIFEVIRPAVSEALRLSSGRIGIIGTRATISSGAYEKEIRRHSKKIQVHSQACPLFVPLIEENWPINSLAFQEIIQNYLTPLKRKKIDTLILGCTHYSFLKDAILQFFGKRVKIIDPAETVAKVVTKFLKREAESFMNLKGRKQRNQIFVTDLTPHFQEIAEKWLGEKIVLKKINL